MRPSGGWVVVPSKTRAPRGCNTLYSNCTVEPPPIYVSTKSNTSRPYCAYEYEYNQHHPLPIHSLPLLRPSCPSSTSLAAFLSQCLSTMVGTAKARQAWCRWRYRYVEPSTTKEMSTITLRRAGRSRSYLESFAGKTCAWRVGTSSWTPWLTRYKEAYMYRHTNCETRSRRRFKHKTAAERRLRFVWSPACAWD